MSSTDVADRDARVVYSVRRLRMTAQQIVDYSFCWPHPFNSVQELDRRIGALKLRKKIRWKSQQSKHEQCVLSTFIKVACDAKRKGIEVTDVEKEYSIPGAGIRADMKFYLGDRLFFLEFEIADKADGWTKKIRKYVRHRKGRGVGPFRVLVVFDNKGPLTRVFYNAKPIMRPHPGLTLFLFGWAPDCPLGQYDSVCNPVWTTHKGQTVPLLEAKRAGLR